MTRWDKREIGHLISRTTAPVKTRTPASFRRSAKHLRDRALVRLIHSKLTTGQICRLDVGDVDLAAGLVYARSPRTKDAMLFEIDAETVEALTKWLSVRGMASRDNTSALFVSLHSTPAHKAPGDRISQRGVCAMLAARAAA